MRRADRTSRGFTLIELVLVILIIGLLLAVVAPSLGGLLRSQKLDAAARTLAGMLKQARVNAAGQAKPYRLVVDSEDNTCWLEVLSASGFERPESSLGVIVELGHELVIELEGGTTEDTRLIARVEPDGMSEIVQYTIRRKQDDKALAVYCRTPTEPYIIGSPRSVTELEEGADDVETTY
ncbi:MAG: prepilin-type N-terminal cleavage/methylation domain-containing protein [Phycisphaeraceae bacterium]|nr:prepilin-type N-terminal cleavage/methylation domain-containing protein [Phycisphaeraceae bacterium]